MVGAQSFRQTFFFKFLFKRVVAVLGIYPDIEETGEKSLFRTHSN